MKKNKIIVGSLVALGFIGVGFGSAHADTVTVKSGDTVSAIASAHNTSVQAIKQLNHLSDVNKIFVGDKLNVNGQAPVQQVQPQRVSQPAQKPQVSQPVQQKAPQPVQQTQQPINSSAKEQVAQIESGGDYNAQNQKYVGKYQLDASYLHGDYSPANQERVANEYVNARYGSWDNALQHEKTFGWY